MLAGTYLPSGPRLRDLVISSLCREAPLEREWRRIRKRKRYQDLVPEIAFQAIDDSVGDKLPRLLDAVLRQAGANGAHATLAAMSAATPIVTTNFDLLLEESGAADVIHIHGSLADPKTMVVRINQVGRGLDPRLRAQIRRTVHGRVLCVLGYSGNDLDVATAITATRPAAILWLTRDTEDRAWSNMQRFVAGHTPIVATIGELGRLSRALVPGRAPAQPQRSEAAAREYERRAAARWASTLTKSERICATAAVLYAIEEYARAGDLGHLAASSTRDKRKKAVALNIAAAARSVEGHYVKAIAAARRVADDAGMPPYERAAALSALSNAYLYQDRFDAPAAVEAARAALRELARTRASTSGREQLRALRGSTYSRLGLALEFSGHLREAVACLKRSIDERRAIGDLKGLATSASNLSLAYYKLDDHRRAAYWRRVALDLLDRYGFAFEKAYLLRRWGALAHAKGRRAPAIALVREALAIYDSIPTAKFGQRHTRQILQNFGVPS